MGARIVNDDAQTVAEHLRLQARGCSYLGSPFYAGLLEWMIDDVEAGGPVWALLEPHAGETAGAAYPIRLLAGVHRAVLSGAAPALAAHFPTTGGDGDVAATWPAFRDFLAAPPEVLLDTLRRPPQTNEVGRSASLAGGLAVVAQRTGLPLRLLEIGTSAALNLRLDRYWYEQDGVGWGDPATAVRFVDLWAPARPPFESGAVVAVRRGCDRDPIDASGLDASDASLTLLSYVWPGQDARFETLRAALDIAAAFPITVDRADAVEWVPSQLAVPQTGLATVVMHSVFWQYLSPETQAAIVASLATAGARATADAPLAWLRLEPSASGNSLELRLTTWPENDESVLAKAGFHAGRVTWLG
jgi:hypothetical protein